MSSVLEGFKVKSNYNFFVFMPNLTVCPTQTGDFPKESFRGYSEKGH